MNKNREVDPVALKRRIDETRAELDQIEKEIADYVDEANLIAYHLRYLKNCRALKRNQLGLLVDMIDLSNIY